MRTPVFLNKIKNILSLLAVGAVLIPTTTFASVAGDLTNITPLGVFGSNDNIGLGAGSCQCQKTNYSGSNSSPSSQCFNKISSEDKDRFQLGMLSTRDKIKNQEDCNILNNKETKLTPENSIIKSTLQNCFYFTGPDCKPSDGSTEVNQLLTQYKISKPKVEINIPNLKFTDLGVSLGASVDSKGYLHIPWLGEYIAGVYSYALFAANIIAIIIIIISGIRVIISAGGDEKNAAYHHIGQAVIGLLILWGSYAILYTINPDLVKFQALKVKVVEPQNYGDEPIDLINLVGISTSSIPQELAPLTSSGHITAYGIAVRADLIPPLQKAVQEYGYDVRVNSGYRTSEQQYSLMQEYCGCPERSKLPANVTPDEWTKNCTKCTNCRASCSVTRKDGAFLVPPLDPKIAGHSGGNAFDIHSTGGSNAICNDQADQHIKDSEGVINTADFNAKGGTCVPLGQQRLIKAMLNNGFCVGLKAGSSPRESWHFEYTKNGVHLSGFCTNNLNDASLKKLWYVQN